MEKPTIPQISVDAQTIYKRLIATAPGEIITYLELNDLVKRDVQHLHRGILETARRKAQREDSIEFAPVRGTGIKRLHNNEISGVASEKMRRASRVARKGLRMLNSVDYQSLTQEERVGYNTTAAGLKMVETIGKSSTLNRIEQIARVTDTTPSIPDISHIFIKK